MNLQTGGELQYSSSLRNCLFQLFCQGNRQTQWYCFKDLIAGKRGKRLECQKLFPSHTKSTKV